MQPHISEPFGLIIEPSQIRIYRSNERLRKRSFGYAPGESQSVIELLVTARAMESLTRLPSKIENGSIQVTFSPDNSLILKRNYEEIGLPLSWQESLTLLLLVKDGERIYRDVSTLGNKRAFTSGMEWKD